MKISSAAMLVLLAPGISAGAESASRRLEHLAAEAQERSFDLFPLAETYRKGAGPRQDRLEIYFTAEHRARQRAHYQWVLGQLKDIPLGELQASEKLTHRLLAYLNGRSLEGLEYPFRYHYIFIQLDGGVAFDLVQLVGQQPFRNEADYQAWLRRLQRYPAFLDAAAQLMREGLEAKIAVPRALVERALSQLDSLAPQEREISKSSLWRPVTRFPDSMGEEARARFEADYRKLLTAEVFPSIRRLAAFVREDYMPRSRTSDGFGALPGGDRMYRFAVKGATTTDLDPEEIHQLGLAEVARIKGRLLAAGEKAGFKGPLSDLRRWLRSNPDNYPFSSGEQVIEYLYGIHARIVPQLPKLFGRIPKARFEIRLTDPAIAASASASWHAPSDDGTRPGVFSIPVVNPKQRSIFGLAALLAHEGMPGHHFDGGIKLENKVPEFRRKLFFVGFGEGWGLYAESLGHDLGLYGNPLELMGRYSFELFRAGRLVADTGIHAKGWTRERAIRYLVEECASTEEGATNEVLRYMAWPGQALGYKIGELAILDIRAKAEKRLGPRFDVRAFHDALLEEGHLPLSMVRERMEAWIDGQAR